jgi:hypothetical protein
MFWYNVRMKGTIAAALVSFVAPDLLHEMGEFERVAEKFGIDSSVLLFQAKQGELVPLDEQVWAKLDNTDSNQFADGDMDAATHNAQEAGRNIADILSKLQAGTPLDAPIIMQYGEMYHLVSGNTRLMAARALGITPTVLLFDVEPPEE